MTTKYKKQATSTSFESDNSEAERQEMIKIGEILAQRPSLKSPARSSSFNLTNPKSLSSRQALVIGTITGLIAGSLLVLILQIAGS
jgi:hypothetical protein